MIEKVVIVTTRNTSYVRSIKDTLIIFYGRINFSDYDADCVSHPPLSTKLDELKVVVNQSLKHRNIEIVLLAKFHDVQARSELLLVTNQDNMLHRIR